MPSEVTHLPQPPCPPPAPPAPAQGLPVLMAADFQPPALAALTALREGGQGSSSRPHGSPLLLSLHVGGCFSSRHNSGADPRAADPARGQEQARTLAGAGTLTRLPRGGREDALEPFGPEEMSRQGLWARTPALCTGAAWLRRDTASENVQWAAKVTGGIDSCLCTLLTAPSDTSRDCQGLILP